jgi:hypothetical protein
VAISIKVNGNSGAEGFLLAPSGGQNFSAPVALKTTDGTTVTAPLVVGAIQLKASRYLGDATVIS